MYENGKLAFGKDFELYLKIKDTFSTSGEASQRFLNEEYEQ